MTEYKIKVTMRNNEVFTMEFNTEFDMTDDLSREYDDEIEDSLTVMFDKINDITNQECDYYDVIM
tara:strand:- start:62 stop:256 length:195 start_codon:yes stop_codon:yes gene_type:complete